MWKGERRARKENTEYQVVAGQTVTSRNDEKRRHYSFAEDASSGPALNTEYRK